MSRGLGDVYKRQIVTGGVRMRLNTVHHIAIITKDYDQTIDFYVNKLGFNIIRENKREDKQDIKLDLQLGDMELEIFIKPDAPLHPFPETAGLRHLAFKVEDVEETVKELNALGIETEPIRFDTFTGKKMTFFKDPDQLPLEIHE